MQIVMEPTSTGWRARPWTEVVEGATPEEVRARLAALVAEYHRRGATFLPVDEDGAAEVWEQAWGAFRDDPTFEEWQRAMDDYRRAIDEDPDAF